LPAELPWCGHRERPRLLDQVQLRGQQFVGPPVGVCRFSPGDEHGRVLGLVQDDRRRLQTVLVPLGHRRGTLDGSPAAGLFDEDPLACDVPAGHLGLDGTGDGEGVGPGVVLGEGAGDLVDEFKKIRIKRSRKTKRMRWVYSGKELIASIRASDHFIIPKEPVVKKIHEKFKYPLNRVVIEDDAVPFVREGKSVFAKFVTGIDPDLRAGDEVIVVDKNDALVGSGNLLLAPKEAMDFKRGAAVNTR